MSGWTTVTIGTDRPERVVDFVKNDLDVAYLFNHIREVDDREDGRVVIHLHDYGKHAKGIALVDAIHDYFDRTDAFLAVRDESEGVIDEASVLSCNDTTDSGQGTYLEVHRYHRKGGGTLLVGGTVSDKELDLMGPDGTHAIPVQLHILEEHDFKAESGFRFIDSAWEQDEYACPECDFASKDQMPRDVVRYHLRIEHDYDYEDLQAFFGDD